MKTETYIALGACARKRIEHEWACSAAERAILQLITDLSFDLGQTWAFVPCLSDFAAVLDIHKSTVSRALRSALKKGYLLVLQRRDETLYSICTETRGNAVAADTGRADEVRARLVALNQTRLQGQADANGQQRLVGVLPSEEKEAPARAFDAMVEADAGETKGVPSESNAAVFESNRAAPATMGSTAMPSNAGGGEESDSEFHQKLEAMVKAAEKRRGNVAMPPDPPRMTQAPVEMAPRGAASDESNLAKEMVKLCRGLSPEQRHVMERLREEFASAGKLQEAQFFKWGNVWRSRAKQYPRQCLEVAGEHKNLRLTVGHAKEPGAWMYRALQELISVNAQ